VLGVGMIWNIDRFWGDNVGFLSVKLAGTGNDGLVVNV